MFNIFGKHEPKFDRIKRIKELKPHFIIDKSGGVTPNPKVHLSIHSAQGLQGISTELDTNQGNAIIEMEARSFHHNTALPVFDERVKPRVLLERTK